MTDWGGFLPGDHRGFMQPTNFRKQLTDLSDACALAQCIVDIVREPILVLDKGLRVIAASRSFYSGFEVSPEDTQGRLLYTLGDGQWDCRATIKVRRRSDPDCRAIMGHSPARQPLQPEAERPAAVHLVEGGPDRELAAAQRYFSYLRMSVPSANMAGRAAPDPTRTQAPMACSFPSRARFRSCSHGRTGAVLIPRPVS
jgi:PAS domain-containing protein